MICDTVHTARFIVLSFPVNEKAGLTIKRLKMEALRAVDAHNEGVGAQNEAVEGL
jgi:hypothetical protein